MDLVTVRELYRNREEYLDKEVTIGGWVRSIRDSKTFGFIVVNDGLSQHHRQSSHLRSRQQKLL